MTDIYQTKTKSLRFRLGEKPLFSVQLLMLVYTVHFLDCHEEGDPDIGGLTLSDEVEGVFFPSYPVGKRRSRLSFRNRMIRYVPQSYSRYYVILKGTFDEYLAKFSSKSRSTLRRKVRKFTKFCGGSVEFRVCRSPQELQDFFQLAGQVSAKTYQEKLLGAGLPDSPEFIEEAVRMASSDHVRAFLLFHDNRPISYLFCPIRENVLYYQYLGYDPEYGNWSPGTVLQYLAMEYLFTDTGAEVFDFTEGEGQHKKFFATGNVECEEIYYLKRTLRNYTIVATHCALHAVTRMTVKTLEFLRIKKIVKKMIRRSA